LSALKNTSILRTRFKTKVGILTNRLNSRSIDTEHVIGERRPGRRHRRPVSGRLVRKA
jgi:hypothetical protein